MMYALRVSQLELPGADVELRRIDFDVEPGEVVGIQGGPGVGKTMLLRLLSGQRPARAARIEILGIDARSEPRRVWESVGYLAGDGAVPVWSNSAASVLRRHAAMKRVPAATLDSEVVRQLRRSGIAADVVRGPGDFDADDRLRLAMAQAWLDDPRLVFLDDPLAAAGADAETQFLTTLEEWLEGDVDRTAVIAARNLQPFAELCTRAFVLRERWLAPIAPGELR